MLDDARSLLKSDGLPSGVAHCVVPGLCRSALEAALVELAWRRRVAAGIDHAVVSAELEGIRGPYELAALAYFGSTKQTNEVLSRLNKYGRWAGDVFQDCKAGGHKAYPGDLESLIRNAGRLVERINAER